VRKKESRTGERSRGGLSLGGKQSLKGNEGGKKMGTYSIDWETRSKARGTSFFVKGLERKIRGSVIQGWEQLEEGLGKKGELEDEGSSGGRS